MASVTGHVILAAIILVLVTVIVYSIQLKREYRIANEAPIYIAKPDWYVTNMEWQPNTVLYDGSNLYYSGNNRPKQNSL